MNASVSVNNLITGVLVKRVIFVTLVHVIWSPIKHAKLINIKNYTCEKRPIGKLVLECQDEILNTTETILNGKRVACSKSNCLINTILFVMICLLMLVINFVIQNFDQNNHFMTSTLSQEKLSIKNMLSKMRNF